MENDDNVASGSHTGKPDEVYLQEMVNYDENDMELLEGIMADVTKVELDLACSSEKLVNCHALSMRLLTQDSDFESLIAENNYILDDSIEKALTFDLLSGFLDSEIREQDNFMDTIHAEMENTRHKISSCRQPREVASALEEKLLHSEASLKQSRQQILEVSMQSMKLQRIVSAFRDTNGKFNEGVDISDNIFACNVNETSIAKMNEQYRHVLWMLEKSLSRELDFEKELSESKKREEELRAKLHYIEQVALGMEEAAEVVWGRFLEVDNRAEVLMGISQELFDRMQIIQFDLACLIQRENETKAKLQDYEDQLKSKDLALQRLNTSSAELVALREKNKSLEEQLKETKNDLKIANSSNEESKEQLIEMEYLVDSLKDSLIIEEGRAESTERKLMQLTESNSEITEELNFLKDSEMKKEKKMRSLEKDLRDMELRLQYAKASIESSQEHQNMLYSAIWDMETHIEDLKSKVSKAESKTYSIEEKCIMLSESNIELKKEVDSLRARVDFLETSLNRANTEKHENSKEIKLRSKYIMDMVIQIAIERERIEKQLSISSNGDKVLMKKALNMKCKNDGTGVIGLT